MSVIIAASILAIAPLPQVERVDAAYDELSNGRNAEAVVELDAAASDTHPATLINLGIAHARQGRTEEARALFDRAAASNARYQLETSGGAWVDSHDLALKAIAALDLGAFARVTVTRTAAR